ncbi:ABC transporter permease [Parabacteroides chinchillae]
MIKIYIKQAFQTLSENRLASVVSILGTALSVAVILVVVLQFQIRQTDYSPVSNRSRMLYAYNVKTVKKQGNEQNNTGLSALVVRECFYSLKEPEAVTALSRGFFVVSVPGKQYFKERLVCYTDPAFWNVFDFRFVAGKPFTKADFDSGLPSAVISDELARSLFGTVDVVGREILMNNVLSCTVAGVVKEASLAAEEAFAEVYLPYTSNSSYTAEGSYEGAGGPFSTVILARAASGFDAIRDEIKRATARYNTGKVEYDMTVSPPLSRIESVLGFAINNSNGWKNYLATTGALLLFLLLVPTLNLTGVIQSSVQKRRSEIGLRKAFGATPQRLFTQLISENLVITMIGGLIGIVLSVGLLYLGKSFLLSESTVITFDMLFKPGLFLAALFFTLLLNILSSGLPAYRITREQIVDALNDDKK